MAKTNKKKKGKENEKGTSRDSPEPAPVIEEKVTEEANFGHQTEEAVEKEDVALVIEENSDEECDSGNQTVEAVEETLRSGDGDENEQEEEYSQSSVDLDKTEPMGPVKMWFGKSEYGKAIRISTRCYIWDAVANLKAKLDDDEFEWFEEHQQFCHFLHMPQEKNHMLMGVWLLILRMAETQKKHEAWFLVNGVPIRYSLREHGLLSGLFCHSYPKDYESFGNLEVVEKHFKDVIPTYAEVETKFLSMKRSTGNNDRLKIAVLYFLSSIVKGQAKTGERALAVENLFMRAISDLDWCKTFPWGRLSFDHSLERILYMVKEFNGVPRPQWCLPNFITPLEILAFEAIPELKKRFREDFISPFMTMCPRMCKSRFKPTYMRGFSLSELNDAIGTNKDIESIIKETLDETALLSKIMEGPLEDDSCDPSVDPWMEVLEKKKKLCFEELYNADVDGRKVENISVAVGLGRRKKGKEKVEEGECGDSFKNIIVAGLKSIDNQMKTLKTEVTGRLNDLDKKLEYVFNYVSSKEKEAAKVKDIEAAVKAKEKQVAMAKKKEAAKAKEKEVDVAKEKEVAKVKEKEVVMAKEKEVAMAKEKEAVAAKEKEVAMAKEKEVVVAKEKAVAKEQEVVEAKEKEFVKAKENEVIKEKKRKKSFSELVTGDFKRPQTRSTLS